LVGGLLVASMLGLLITAGPASAAATSASGKISFSASKSKVSSSGPYSQHAETALVACQASVVVDTAFVFGGEDSNGEVACSYPMSSAVVEVQVASNVPDFVSTKPDAVGGELAYFSEQQFASSGVHNVQVCVAVTIAGGGSGGTCFPRFTLLFP
jgi:hypothetical protein